MALSAANTIQAALGEMGVNPAAAAAAPVLAPPSIVPKNVQEAIGVNRAVQQEAASIAANDPVQQQLRAAEQAEIERKQKLMAEATALQQQRQALVDEPQAPLPDAPEIPDMEAAPGPRTKGPLETLGQYLPVLGALSGGNVRGNTVAALNAAAGAMNAIQANDTAEAEKQHKLWIDNMDMALKKSALLQQKYTSILASRKMTMDEKLAKINGLAAAADDKIAMASVSSGIPEAIQRRAGTIAELSKPLVEMVQKAKDDETQRRGQDITVRGQNVSAETARLDRAAANTRAQNAIDASEAREDTPSEADVKGRLAVKIETNGWNALSQNEKEVWVRMGDHEMNPRQVQRAVQERDGGAAPAAPPATPAPKTARAPAQFNVGGVPVKVGEVLVQGGKRYKVDAKGVPQPF